MPDNPSDVSPSKPAGLWRVAGTAMTLLLLVAGIGGMGYIWSIEPDWGRGMQIVVTYGIVLLMLLVGLLWVTLFSRFRWKSIAAAFGLLLLAAVAGAASVREVEFGGDMQVILHYRWEPTQEELIRRHRESVTEIANEGASGMSVGLPTAEDAPAYRGANRDGVIVGPPLKQDWDSDPPRELWRQPCGGGYASFSVLGNFLVTIEQRGGSEAVVCYDAATGRERWTHEYSASFAEPLGGTGPRATPTIDDGTVFSFGALGDLVALDLVTGDVRWAKDLLPEGWPVVQWGMCSSPLVVGQQVIVEVGGPNGDGLVSLHRDTGDVLWQRPGVDRLSEPDAKSRAGYSSPMLATIDGVEQVLIFDGEGLRSHATESGEQLWFHPFRSGEGVSVAQPIVFEDGRIFLSMSYGIGCRMIRVSQQDGQWQEPVSLWDEPNLNMKCKFTSPVLHDGYIYGLDEGILACIDSVTGKRMWKGGREGTRGRFYHGQILLTNGQILGFTERGDLVLVEATPDAYRELAHLSVLDTRKVWNPHILSRGIVYVRSHEEMVALDLNAK